MIDQKLFCHIFFVYGHLGPYKENKLVKVFLQLLHIECTAFLSYISIQSSVPVFSSFCHQKHYMALRLIVFHSLWVLHFKWMNCICELYSNKAFKNKKVFQFYVWDFPQATNSDAVVSWSYQKVPTEILKQQSKLLK